MTWLKRALPALAIALLSAVPAVAQVAGRPFEISGGAGIFSYDGRSHRHDGPAYIGALGWRIQPWLTLEGQAAFGPADSDTFPEPTNNFTHAGLDFRFNLRPAENRVVPYVITGLGYGLSHSSGTPPDKLERGAGSLGVGVLLNVLNPRTYVRIQARDVWFRERDALEFSNHVVATAGLQYVFGGKYRDQDLDGVRDWLDKCPGTPIGASVDANGCPTDADRDSVYDGLDKCPDTPAGCRVDRNGCPIDTDGDGVCDGLDQCADTPKGATVDLRGCTSDSDADSVLDGIDQCPGTQQGCVVDATGCPKDTDRDGVCDGLDKCPDTPANYEVDPQGCTIEVIERETELLDTGMIRLQDVNFETAKADLLPESLPKLDVVGQVLSRWPELKIEIGGHTDFRGSDAYNQKLSEARTKSVLDYLLGKFPELQRGQFTVKGYGEKRPIAPNTTERGMALNRRVEFVVQNREVLRRESSRPRFLKRGESTPAPGSSPPATSPPAPSPPGGSMETAPPSTPPSLGEPSIPAPSSAPPDTTSPAPPDSTR